MASLKQYRMEVHLSIERLAAKAEVSKNTVVNAEKKNTRMNRSVATAILKALNSARLENDLPPVEMKDIDWNVKG